MRGSYGYQQSYDCSLRSPKSAKGFPMPHSHAPTHDSSMLSSIQQLEHKLEGVEGRIKQKQLEHVQNESHVRSQQQLSTQQLRGSCQQVLHKFDYYAQARNSTRFGAKNGTQQSRKSPGSPHQRHKAFPVQGQKHETGNKERFNPFRGSPKKPTKDTSSIVQQLQQCFSPANKPPQEERKPSKEKKKVFTSLEEVAMVKAVARQGRRASTVVEGFEVGRNVGFGKFGEVFVGRHCETGMVVALKRLAKEKVRAHGMVEHLGRQIQIHSMLHHPNIVRFYGAFSQGSDVYLVMEYMNGGTLFDMLNEMSALPVKTAVEYLRDIIEAVSHMHSMHIAHRDIKPENIVVSSEGVAKLCDFGWSAVVDGPRLTYCGTLDYAPPQMIERKQHDASIDIWCLGVLTYELLTGRVPFQAQQRNQVRHNIVNVDKMSFDYPPHVPAEAKEFIECLVQKDPALRPKCQDLLSFSLFSTHLAAKTHRSKGAVQD